MTPPLCVLVTGASGCVGHRVVHRLLQAGTWRVRALVRDPGRCLLPPHPLLEVVAGDLLDLREDSTATRGVAAIAHLATAWGDPVAYPVNVGATLALARLGRPMVYLSTASILDGAGALLPQAETLGTDYIRSKALAYRGLREEGLTGHVRTLFPTLVVAGTRDGPASHLGRGLARSRRWLSLARHVTLEARFHFIHAGDLARMVVACLQAPDRAGDHVVGQPAISLEAALAELSACHGIRRRPWFDLEPWLRPVAGLAGARMTAWDRHCLKTREFVYAGAMAPETVGMTSEWPNLSAIAKYEGWLAA
ncbi:MAG: NAD-dependent epimerase/dehydratase family protein [Candidatus Sericytochromatia bacterium]|nr:NAD-dependent epimerase/dehydratase family protein [Candidatus Sericytochromatia bacterium]